MLISSVTSWKLQWGGVRQQWGGVAAAAQMRPRRFRRCTKRGSSLWDGSVTTIEWDYNHCMYIYVRVSINGATQEWMVYTGKSYESRSFGGTPISGNVHICVMLLNTHNTIINTIVNTLQPLNIDNYLL